MSTHAIDPRDAHRDRDARAGLARLTGSSCARWSTPAAASGCCSRWPALSRAVVVIVSSPATSTTGSSAKSSRHAADRRRSCCRWSGSCWSPPSGGSGPRWSASPWCRSGRGWSSPRSSPGSPWRWSPSSSPWSSRRSAPRSPRPTSTDNWTLPLCLFGQDALYVVLAMLIGIAFGTALSSAPAIVLYFGLPIAIGALGSISAISRERRLARHRRLEPLTEEVVERHRTGPRSSPRPWSGPPSPWRSASGASAATR